ncbi:hypothetical protein Tco_0722841, partial [Tanacetum coccineum]
ATVKNAHKVADEILFRSPEAIVSTDQSGYDIIQIAVINRSERIYNLIYDIGERKNLYRTIEDSFLRTISMNFQPSYTLLSLGLEGLSTSQGNLISYNWCSITASRRASMAPDAISLFASSTTLLVFLSILTARFSEKDFLVSIQLQLCSAWVLLSTKANGWMLAPICDFSPH